MKILFIAAQLYLPQLYGGVQTSTDQLCRAMMARGHKVALLMKLTSGGWFGLRGRISGRINQKLLGCKVARDRDYGYPVWRAWFPDEAMDFVIAREKPDLIVAMTGGEFLPLTLHAQANGVPLLIQLHDVALNEYGQDFEKLGPVHCVANSHFTAEKYRAAFGATPSVIHPFLVADLYRTVTLRKNVTFINPVRVKGVSLAIEIARQCPEIPFSFIEGWTLSDAQRNDLTKELAALPNVTLHPSYPDMRAAYSTCKILLVPSIYEETYGRVVTEAQVNGIPVLASSRGGLPESVGEGGIILSPDAPAEDWANALRNLWQDENLYAATSAAALAHAQRPALDYTHQVDMWAKAFTDAIAAFHAKTLDHDSAAPRTLPPPELTTVA